MITTSLIEYAILNWLQNGEAYGYQLKKEFDGNSEDDEITGSLYNALDRLIKKGWVNEEWRERRKYYSITGDGLSVVRDTKTRHKI